MTVKKEDIPAHFPRDHASIQWFVHLDEFNTYKAFSRTTSSRIEQSFRMGRTSISFDWKHREYTINFESMLQENTHTSRLRHVMRGFFPISSYGHKDTALPVEVDSD